MTDPTKLVMGKDSTIPDYVLDTFQRKDKKGVAEGYASLGADGIVPLTQLPHIPLDQVEDTSKEDKANKGQADGYAPLDSSTKVPLANLPDAVTQPDADKEDKAQKSAADGYAPLDADRRVPSEFLPRVVHRPDHTFATQAEMVAGGAGMHAGENVIVHGDPVPANNGEYLVAATPPTTLADFDHKGQHIVIHRHAGSDIDLQVGGSPETLQHYIDALTNVPHHTYPNRAAMIADGARQLAGEVILIHGNPLEDGEYVPKIDQPTVIANYDRMGGLLQKHLHMGGDITIHYDGRSENLQTYITQHRARFDTLALLPNHPLTAGSLRALETGVSYSFPAIPRESSPNAGDLVGFSQMGIAGIYYVGHQFANAVLIRTGPQTWTIYAEMWTGTSRQPTVEWNLDLDPLWEDHTGIGGQGATSFTGAIADLVAEIGDSSLFGSHTLVEKIRFNEVKLNLVSTRVAAMEGFTANGHLDVVQDFHLHINNQGEHYLIINDSPTDPAHIGKDLFDGHEHKVALKWDARPPYSASHPFDPTHIEEPAGTGAIVDWTAAGNAPSVWIMHGSDFKHLIDPLTHAVFAFPAIASLADHGQILTVRWNMTDSQLEVLKIEEPSVHVVSTPDHMPLQIGGSVAAKYLTFQALDADAVAAIPEETFYLNAAKRLEFKELGGVVHDVIGPAHYHGVNDPTDDLGEDGDIYHRVSA